MQILLSIFFFVIAIGVLVTVHEFGHFWVARRLGVKVLRFSIGFGKPLWGWRRQGDETEYVIAAIPLGGYVQMLDEREGPVDEKEFHLAFNRKPLMSRFAVVFAGPLFNFIFAFFAYWLIFMIGVSGLKPIVGEISTDSAAARGGFQYGDVIRSIEGQVTPTWDSVFLQLLDKSLSSQTVSIEVRDQNGMLQQRQLDFASLGSALARDNLMVSIGMQPYRPPLPAVIGRLEPGGAAQQAGIRIGDRIVGVDGREIDKWLDWVDYVRTHPGERLQVTILRQGGQVELDLIPERLVTEDGDIGRIGAGVRVPDNLSAEIETTVRYSPWHALSEAMKKTWQMSALTLRMLMKMITGEVSASNISGPISIAQYAGYSAGVGFVAFMGYLALISISLGVLNLLPVPVLDGGHLMYYLIEFVKGSPVSEEVQMLGQRIGIALLIGVMLLAFYNDFVRLLS